MHRTQSAERVLLRLRPHNVHQANAVGQADLVEHLAQVGRRRCVDQRGVPLASHRLDHRERGEWVDKARGAFGCGRAFGQHETLLGLDAAVLRVHRPADYGHRLTQQRPGLLRFPGGDDDARTFVSDRHGLVKTTGEVSHALGRNRGGHHRTGRPCRNTLRCSGRPRRTAAPGPRG